MEHASGSPVYAHIRIDVYRNSLFRQRVRIIQGKGDIIPFRKHQHGHGHCRFNCDGKFVHRRRVFKGARDLYRQVKVEFPG